MRMDEQTNPEWKRQCQGSKSGRKALAEIERLECSLAISRKKHELAIEVNKSLQARVEALEDNAVVDEANYMAALDRIAELEGALHKCSINAP